MKILVTHIIISEFGWEICEVQGAVRKQGLGCDKVVVFTRPNRDFLYTDIPGIEIHHHNIKGEFTDHTIKSLFNPEALVAANAERDTLIESYRSNGDEVIEFVLTPAKDRFRLKFIQDGNQSYKRFGIYTVVHQRAKLYINDSERNYPIEEWSKIISGLRELGNVYAIGTKEEASCTDGCIDRRGLDLGSLTELLAGAAVVVGPSSGPMHLASFCGTPHVVWSDQRRWRTPERYERGWNPFNTPCVIIKQPNESWTAPEEIIKAAKFIMRGSYVDKTPAGSGIIYVTTGQSFVDILEISLSTLRNVYKGPVTILTTSEDEGLGHLYQLVSKYNINIKEVPVTVPEFHQNPNHYKSRWLKTQLYLFTPYEHTLYIDNDTMIMQPIDTIWDIKGDFIVKPETICPTVDSRSYANCSMERQPTIDICGIGFPHYSSSTILFHKNKDVAGLFRCWHDEWVNYADTYYTNCPKVQDQPALMRAIKTTNKKIYTLPLKFNTVNRTLDGIQGGDILTNDTVIYSTTCRGNGKFKEEANRLFPWLVNSCPNLFQKNVAPRLSYKEQIRAAVELQRKRLDGSNE